MKKNFSNNKTIRSTENSNIFLILDLYNKRNTDKTYPNVKN